MTTPGPYGGAPVPPMNAPPGASPSIGVQPGQSPAVEFARVIIIYGTGLVGLFEYEGTPAAGNPPIAYSAPPGVSVDLYGNTLPQTAGGFTSINPDVEWAALSSGGLYIAGLGTLASAIPASVQMAAVGGTEQTLQLSSGAGPEAGATDTLLEVSDTGAGGSVLVNAALDGNTYDVERLTLSTAGTQTFDATAGTPVTGLAVPVAADATYRIRARIRVTTAAAGGNAEINFTGPATSLCELGGSWRVVGSSGSALEQENTGLGGVFSSFGLNSGGQVFYLDGIVTFSAKGTLTMQGTCTSAADTWTTVAGCTLDIEPVTA